MTDTEISQLRQNLMARFEDMMHEALPPGEPGQPQDTFEWGARN